MPETERDLAQRRARIARARRRHDPVAEQQARSDYAEAKLAAYITQVVEAAPPLTAEQRDRLALLLRGGAAA